MRLTEGPLARHYQAVEVAGAGAARHRAGPRPYTPSRSWVVRFGSGIQGTHVATEVPCQFSRAFSTDLDFYTPDDDVTLALMDALATADIDGFRFHISDLGGDDRRALLDVDRPFGRPDVYFVVPTRRDRVRLRRLLFPGKDGD